MFDLGLSKLAVIGVVALIVIGPERLPKVARTVGTLLGRAQRYLADVKAEVNREMQMDEMRAAHEHVKSAASSFESSVHRTFNEAHDTFREVHGTLDGAFETSPAPQMMPLAAPMVDAAREPMSPARRNKWRRSVTQRQSAAPMWFKSVSRKRTRVQSGAARVARYRVR